MTARQAARARRIALDTLIYRRWSAQPAIAAIPPITVLSNSRIHRHEHDRDLRRAQNNVFSSPAAGFSLAI